MSISKLIKLDYKKAVLFKNHNDLLQELDFRYPELDLKNDLNRN